MFISFSRSSDSSLSLSVVFPSPAPRSRFSTTCQQRLNLTYSFRAKARDFSFESDSDSRFTESIPLHPTAIPKPPPYSLYQTDLQIIVPPYLLLAQGPLPISPQLLIKRKNMLHHLPQFPPRTRNFHQGSPETLQLTNCIFKRFYLSHLAQ